MAKKRVKQEVQSELARLSALRDSEQFRLMQKLLMDKLSLKLKTLLSSTLSPQDIMSAVIEARAIYESITMVPGEEYALLDELYRIEQEERSEVEESSRMGRTYRMGGAV